MHDQHGEPRNQRCTDRALRILGILAGEFPDRRPLLQYETPFELLVAVILSAQTTDDQVNRVTPDLFRAYPTPAALAAAPIDEVRRIVFPTGFYRRKADHIVAAARVVVERYAGTVPIGMDDLTAIPGVGRKSAGVIRCAVYGLPAIIVDTHFGRVVRRLGFTDKADPRGVEDDLTLLLPPSEHCAASMRLNLLGRRFCTARRPRCPSCPVCDHCPFPDSQSDASVSSPANSLREAP